MNLLSKVRYNVRRIQARYCAWSERDRHTRAGRILLTPPCYHLMDWLDEKSVFVDCGLGFDADFSQGLIKRFNVTSFGFDPTRKHLPALEKVSEGLDGKLILHPVALAARNETLLFHESVDEVSGSIDPEHWNIRQGESLSYDVAGITINDIFELLDVDRIHLFKMDIEGAEYDVLMNADEAVLSRIDQFVIEFHHDLMDYTFDDTKECIDRLASFGFECYTRDNVNFLFYNPACAPACERDMQTLV